jgi:DNA replication protein DnaC
VSGGGIAVFKVGRLNIIRRQNKLNGRTCVMVTNNLSFREWAMVFGGAKLTSALLDRLTHRSYILETGSFSFSFKASYTTASKRKKKRNTPLTTV